VVRIDLVTESLNVGTMVALIFLFLNLIASLFMSCLQRTTLRSISRPPARLATVSATLLATADKVI
jgi:hypothetical protein